MRNELRDGRRGRSRCGPAAGPPLELGAEHVCNRFSPCAVYACGGGGLGGGVSVVLLLTEVVWRCGCCWCDFFAVFVVVVVDVVVDCIVCSTLPD